MQALVQRFSVQKYEAQVVMFHVYSTVSRGGFLETVPAGIRDPIGLGSNIAKQCWMITFTQTAQKWGKSPGVQRPLAKQLQQSQRRGILRAYVSLSSQGDHMWAQDSCLKQSWAEVECVQCVHGAGVPALMWLSVLGLFFTLQKKVGEQDLLLQDRKQINGSGVNEPHRD